jgi:hypothetical protein
MTFCRPAIQRIVPILTAALLAMPVGTARADSLFGDPTRNGPADELPIDTRASQRARAELAQARLDLTRARMAAGRVERIAELQARRASGFQSLQVIAAQAVTAYQAAQRAPIAKLSRDPEYVQLTRQRDALRAEMRRLADSRKPSDPEIQALAKRAMLTGQRITRAETIAMALDPAVEDARAEMTDAYAAVRRVSMSARERAMEFPEVTMAHADVNNARDRVTQANQELVAALRAEAAVDRDRDSRFGRPRGM